MRTLLGAIGRVLVTLGLLLLLFVAYQLWGTGIYQARAQENLKHDFESELVRARAGSGPTTSGPTTSGPTTSGPSTTGTSTAVPSSSTSTSTTTTTTTLPTLTVPA